MNPSDYPKSGLVGVFILLVLMGAARADVFLTPADFHNPHPESMIHGSRGVLFTRGESWEPSATAIPFPHELHGASEIIITVYFIPAALDVEGDVCFCAGVSSDSPGEPAFGGETYCSIPETVDSEWGDDWLGSSEIITPGYMSEGGELLYIALSRDTNETPEDDYPGDVWFCAMRIRAAD